MDVKTLKYNNEYLIIANSIQEIDCLYETYKDASMELFIYELFFNEKVINTENLKYNNQEGSK